MMEIRLAGYLMIAVALTACASAPTSQPSVVPVAPSGVVAPADASSLAIQPDTGVESAGSVTASVTLPDTGQPAQQFADAPKGQSGARVSMDASPLDGLLRDAYQFRLLSAPQLAAEIERLERIERLEATAEHTLRWALALAQTLQVQDTQRALALVQRVLESPDPQSVTLRPLAHLLGHLLREQRRLDLQNERLSQQLRESQRRVEQLNDRIEAMRAIERSLNRPPPSSAPPRPTAP